MIGKMALPFTALPAPAAHPRQPRHQMNVTFSSCARRNLAR